MPTNGTILWNSRLHKIRMQNLKSNYICNYFVNVWFRLYLLNVCRAVGRSENPGGGATGKASQSLAEQYLTLGLKMFGTGDLFLK